MVNMIKRRKSRQIKVGDVRIGGNAPVSIQSMTKVDTSNVKATISQTKNLEDAGCEIVRVAVKTFEDANAIRRIRRKIKIPLVADIHFNYKLALKAIENGADKIRLNPGNIRKKEEIVQVVKAAKKARIPIRIGANSGSVSRARSEDITSALVNSTLDYIELFEEMDFRDIIISLKASDVVSTVESYRRMARLCDYPFHLGITAAGLHDSGIVKSAIGIGALLLDGIGDTIRVSLTSPDPVDEVIAGKKILSSLGIRRFGPEVIACPTCGRCQIDLAKIVKDLECNLSAINQNHPRCGQSGHTGGVQWPLQIAVMGCEVNGPGEAMDADIGIAFGKGSGMLFKKGKIVKKVSAKTAVKELLKYL